MAEKAYNPIRWVTVKCPVCKQLLGTKRSDEIESFICNSEGCSETKHTFYPGQIKKPGKSEPWSSYYYDKRKCGCFSCNPK